MVRAILIPLIVALLNLLVSLFPQSENPGGRTITWRHFDSFGWRLYIGSVGVNLAYLSLGKHINAFYWGLLALGVIGVAIAVLHVNLAPTHWKQVVSTSALGLVAMFVIWGIWSIWSI